MNVERLEKLAEHLESGQLGHEVFDFSTYNNSGEPSCGTAGCALGECPIIWPNKWRFDRDGAPIIKSKPFPHSSATVFFKIDSDEAGHLFYPNKQKPNLYGGKELDETATRYEVAANIREFIKVKQNNQ